MQPTRETLRLRARSTQFERDVQRYLCPIYGVSGSVGRPIGSGFLLQLSSATLLVTAAHVVHEMHSCTLHTIDGSRIVPIEGSPYSTGPRIPHSNPDFGHDIAFIVLNEERMEAPLSPARLQPSDLDPNDIPAESIAYGFVGMPASENQPSGYVFDGMSYYYGGLPAPEEVYKWLGYRPATHFVMKFEREAMIDESSRVTQVPEPRGMSGGPVFRLGTFHEIEAEAPSPKVIAVTTEWWPRQQVLVAVRISLVIDCIRQLLPEYAHELPTPAYIEGTVTRPASTNSRHIGHE